MKRPGAVISIGFFIAQIERFVHNKNDFVQFIWLYG